MRADEIMTDEVTTIDETATLAEALELMEARDIRHLPVVRGQEVVGILSDRDVRSHGVSLVSDFESLEALQARLRVSVSAVMSANVITVEPSTDVVELVDILLEEKINAVPVVDEETNELLGIVSTADVLRAMRDVLEAA